jgi:hypothetical protein
MCRPRVFCSCFARAPEHVAPSLTYSLYCWCCIVLQPNYNGIAAACEPGKAPLLLQVAPVFKLLHPMHVASTQLVLSLSVKSRRKLVVVLSS